MRPHRPLQQRARRARLVPVDHAVEKDEGRAARRDGSARLGRAPFQHAPAPGRQQIGKLGRKAPHAPIIKLA